VIPYRKYKEAKFLIAHSVVDVRSFAVHFTTWQYLFEDLSAPEVCTQLRAMQDSNMKKRILTEALKMELPVRYIRKVILIWGLDVRGFDIFPVVNLVGAGKWGLATLLKLSPIVAQLMALGSRCAIFHPCSPVIIKACRAGIITNLLWRWQRRQESYLPNNIILKILHFIMVPFLVEEHSSKRTWRE